MTVALDATPLSVSTGGVRRYTLELTYALCQEFPEDKYWLVSDQPFTVPSGGTGNLRCGDGPRTAFERNWWSWGLERELSRCKADVFHGADFSVPYFPIRPSVMTVHDLSPWMDPGWQPDASRVRQRTPVLLRMRIPSMIITPSEAVRHAAIDRFGLDPSRVVAIPLAANACFRPVETKPAQPYFLFVGTLEPRKNIGRLIEAWRQVRKEHGVDLILAGRVRRDFTAPAGEPGLSVLGAVEEAELPKLYSGAAACIYPSLYEGFGLPVLEAMQCGTLTITSRDPAIMEVAAGAAVHIDAEDTRALAEAMDAALNKPAQFADVKARALATAGEFTWQRTARRTREIYAEAARNFRKK